MATIWRYWRKYVGDGVCVCGRGVFRLKTFTGMPDSEPVVMSLCDHCDMLTPAKI